MKQELIKELQKSGQISFYEEEIKEMVLHLSSFNINQMKSDEEWLEILEKYRFPLICLKAIYSNPKSSNYLIRECLKEKNNGECYETLLKRNDIKDEIIEEIISKAGLSYLLTLIAEYEAQIKNEYYFSKNPLSEKVYYYIIKNYNNEEHKYIPYRYISNSLLLEKRLDGKNEDEFYQTVASNINITADVRDKAYAISNIPEEIVKTATKYMTQCLYESTTETLFEIEHDEKYGYNNPNGSEEEVLTKTKERARDILIQLIENNRLNTSQEMDLLNRIKLCEEQELKVELLHCISKHSHHSSVLNKILSIENIKYTKTEENVIFNQYLNLSEIDRIAYRCIMDMYYNKMKKDKSAIGQKFTLILATDIISKYGIIDVVEHKDIMKNLNNFYLNFSIIKSENITDKDKEILLEDNPFLESCYYIYKKINKISNLDEKHLIDYLFEKSLYNTINTKVKNRDMKYENYDLLHRKYKEKETQMCSLTESTVNDIKKTVIKELNKCSNNEIKIVLFDFISAVENEYANIGYVEKLNNLLEKKVFSVEHIYNNMLSIDYNSLMYVEFTPEKIQKIKDMNLTEDAINTICNTIEKTITEPIIFATIHDELEKLLTFYKSIDSASILYNIMTEIKKEKDIMRKEELNIS